MGERRHKKSLEFMGTEAGCSYEREQVVRRATRGLWHLPKSVSSKSDFCLPP